MAQYHITLSDGNTIYVGDSFLWRGTAYRLVKLNPTNARIADSDGKEYNLNKRALTSSAVKADSGVAVVTPSHREIKRDADRELLGTKINTGVVCTYADKPGLWVVIKLQPQTGRADIVTLGGDSKGLGRDWEWRVPASKLVPVDEINNFGK